jgi:ubiquinone/menaquinone biosynthesis C-methylase UbiE
VNRLDGYLAEKGTVIDIGAGWCNVAEILEAKGMEVLPLDVKDLSLVEGIDPVIYDGVRIPFEDNTFDLALLLTVLHHTHRPEEIVKEARRVARSMVIIEDIFTNTAGKYWTFAMDSLLNLEFIGHPHSNKRDQEWRVLFNELGLKLKDAKYQRSFVVFKHATYYLEK